MNTSNATTTIKSTVRLHPNPCDDVFHISGFEGTATVHISDLNCIPMLKQQITPDEHIDINKLKKGVYIAKIITTTETLERKLVKG